MKYVILFSAGHSTSHFLAPMIAKGYAFGDAKVTIRLFDDHFSNKFQLGC